MDIELSEDIAPEYLEDVWNILTNSEFLRLSQYVHHHWTNRFMHRLNVSYLSWLIAGKLGCDARAAARAAPHSSLNSRPIRRRPCFRFRLCRADAIVLSCRPGPAGSCS